MTSTLVFGASGGLGRALVAHYADNGRTHAISRSARPDDCPAHTDWWTTDAHDMQHIAESFVGEQIDKIFICSGMLHDKARNIWPEKRIEDLHEDAALAVFQTNALVPMRWLQSLMPLLRQQKACVVTVFSARVGSIGDNKLGGWYSYRASKAALNMMLTTFARELKWRAPGVKLIAFHPGTTDTPLSEPFQRNVPEGKLFSPRFVAEQASLLSERATFDGEVSFIDWQGENIPW